MLMELERLYGWEAETRSGKVYSSDLLNNGNRGGYDALPHDDIAVFRITMLVHPMENGLALGAAKKFNIVTIHLDLDERVVYRRRVTMAPGAGRRVCILAGAHKNVRGRDALRLHWIFEDTGEVHCTSRYSEGIFDSPNIREYEVAP